MIKSGVAELRHGTARHPRRHGASESTTRDRMKPSLGRVWRDGLRVCWKGTVTLPLGYEGGVDGRKDDGLWRGERDGLVEAAWTGEIQSLERCVSVYLLGIDKLFSIICQDKQSNRKNCPVIPCPSWTCVRGIVRWSWRPYFISHLLSMCPPSLIGTNDTSTQAC